MISSPSIELGTIERTPRWYPMEDHMDDQNSGEHSFSNGAGNSRTEGGKTSSRTSEIAQEALHLAKEAASGAASTATSQVKNLLNRQVGAGADYVAHVAHSAKLAADDLDQHAPQIAGLVRGLAEQVETYSDDLRDQSVDDLVRTASNFTRKQPALVFALAALAGFFAYRVMKATPDVASPSIQPGDEGQGQHRSRRTNGL
jgi:hypothetical protein